MKITNKYNVPEVFVNVLKDDTHRLSDEEISVTTLIAPVYQYYLRRKYDDQIEIDVSEQLWIMFGKAIHGMLEKYGENRIVEKKFITDINGVKVTGIIDAYDPEKKVLEDYKVTSTYSISNENTNWTKQLNCYSYLLSKNGYEVREAYIYAILRDWSYGSYKSKGNSYPDKPFVVKKIELWSLEETEKFLIERVEKFKELKEGKVEVCSAEERWFRNGRNIRCELYCPVRRVCEYAKNYNENRDK